MPKAVTDKSLVRQSNRLVDAKPITPYTLNEHKLSFVAMASVHDDDTHEEEYKIQLNDVYEMLGLQDDPNRLKRLKDIADTINKTLSVEKDDGSWHNVWLFDNVSAEKDLGVLKVKFTSSGHQLVKGLRKNFTSFQLREITKTKCRYTPKMFQLLKKDSFKGKTTLRIEDIKEKLAIPLTKYQRFDHFKTRILIAVQKDMEANTLLRFTFDEVKEKRKVVAIEFTIKDNMEAVKAKMNDADREVKNSVKMEYYKIMERYGLQGIDKSKVQIYIDALGEKLVQQVLDRILEKNLSPDRIPGYLITELNGEVTKSKARKKVESTRKTEDETVKENRDWWNDNIKTLLIPLWRGDKPILKNEPMKVVSDPYCFLNGEVINFNRQDFQEYIKAKADKWTEDKRLRESKKSS